MKIDVNAPLMARKEITIDAPVELVWQIQSDINNWSKWQKDVSFAKLHGKLVKGTVFTWKAMGMNITSELQEVIEQKTIEWSGKSIGMYAIHRWSFQKHGSKTKVITEESLSGWFPKLIKVVKPNFLEQSLFKALQTLKNYVEVKK